MSTLFKLIETVVVAFGLLMSVKLKTRVWWKGVVVYLVYFVLFGVAITLWRLMRMGEVNPFKTIKSGGGGGGIPSPSSLGV